MLHGEAILRGLARLLAVETLELVVDFAAPTVHPCAWAVKQMCAAHPWVGPMHHAFPDMPFRYFALQRKIISFGWCSKCDSCFVSQVRRLRRKCDDHFDDSYILIFP